MLRIVKHTRAQWKDAEPVWRMLAARSAEASFFLSAEWTRSWLHAFGDLIRSTGLIFHAGDQPVGAVMLVERTVRRALIPLHQVFLNTSGEDATDETCIEFNNVLCLPGWHSEVAAALVACLEGMEWDELVLEGFADGPLWQAITSSVQGKVCTQRRTSNYVDLDALRAAGRPYLSVLRSRTRTYVRENLRIHGEAGPVVIREAGGVTEALGWLDEMADLHQQRWVARGQSGAFASERFCAFHRSLIRTAFDDGHILLLRVSAASTTVGILYNFVWRKRVVFYQSGFRYDEERHTRPGLLTFALGVQYCLDRGFSEFDFLAGGDHYKRDLSTGSRELIWTTIQRSSMVTHAVGLIKWSKRAITRTSVLLAVASAVAAVA